MISAIRGLLFRRLPLIPGQGKWTKCGPCVDVILLGLWLHGVMIMLLTFVFGGQMKGLVFKSSSDDDQDFVQEMAWSHSNETKTNYNTNQKKYKKHKTKHKTKHKDKKTKTIKMAWAEVAGKRMKKTLRFYQDSDLQPKLSSYAIIKEGTRFLTAGFLRCSRSTGDTHHYPRICDYASACFSRVTVVLQYYSQLLAGKGKRLALLFAAAGCSCLAAWLETPVGQRIGLLLHHGAVVAATWVHTRHARVFKKFPWRLARIVDPRLSYAVRLGVSQEVYDACSKCLDKYMTRRIQAEIEDACRSK